MPYFGTVNPIIQPLVPQSRNKTIQGQRHDACHAFIPVSVRVYIILDYSGIAQQCRHLVAELFCLSASGFGKVFT